MIKNARIIGQDIDPEAYHRQDAERGTPDFALSPSSLKEFARCPARWIAGYNSPGSDAKSWGNILDTLALQPAKFASRYAVRPETYPAPAGHVKVKKGELAEGDTLPWNANAGVCQEWAEANAGREILSPAMMERADAALARLRADSTIAAMIDGSAKQVLVVGEWHDEPIGIVTPIRCLMDMVPAIGGQFPKSLADLKTTRSAALVPFQRAVWQFGWHVQAAFDLDLYCAATGEDRCQWVFVVQESFEPWQTAKRLLAEDYVNIGRRDYQQALTLYSQCRSRQKWPDYDSTDEARGLGGFSLVSPEPWMESAGQFAPQFEIEPDAEAPEGAGRPSGARGPLPRLVRGPALDLR